jgi:hypothetical protein
MNAFADREHRLMPGVEEIAAQPAQEMGSLGRRTLWHDANGRSNPTMAATIQLKAANPPLAVELRRYAVVTAVVALWMAIGWTFGFVGDAYVVLGVPLLWFFQRYIARRPLLEVWFAEPGRLTLPWWGWLIAAAFMVQPVHTLATWQNPGWAARLWLVCATVGAVPLAWSLARCTRKQWRELGLCLVTTGAAAGLTLAASYFARSHPDRAIADRLLEGLRSLVLYLPVCFMIEEVFFRGGLDSYLTRGGTRAPWLSAFYLSAIWGWWHLPTVTLQPEHRIAQLVVLVVALPLVHCGIGALFSIFWRRSGLLLVPVFAHAFIDAVRNALQ